MGEAKEVVLQNDLPFSEFVRQGEASNVVDSHSFVAGQWKARGRLRGFPTGIMKHVVPVDISYANFLVITSVEPGSKVHPHTHDEPQFRYVIHGSLSLNGKRYVAGDWVFVPAGIPYHIETDEGYTTLGCYGVQCEEPNGKA